MSDWQPIDEIYEVSRDGRVRHHKGREIGQWLNDRGYFLVRLSRPRRMRFVHRLVAAAFIPNPDNLPCVNHLNCDRADNHDANLEWCTQKQNLQYAWRLGRMPGNYWQGKRSPNAGLTDERAALVRERYAAGGVSQASLGASMGISKRTVGRIINGETYV